MCSRVGHSLHLLDGTPCRHNGPRFRVCLFLHGFWPPTPRTAGRGNCVPRPRPLCPGGRPLAFSSPLRTFSMDAAKGNPLLGGALGFPPVSAGSSCRAFVRSLARAFRLAGHSSGPWRAPSSERPSARGQLGNWPRPAVGGVFRRRSRPCRRMRCHARGRVMVAPRVSRSCRSNHRRRRGHLAVTLQ